jgi:hypothetical protein
MVACAISTRSRSRPISPPWWHFAPTSRPPRERGEAFADAWPPAVAVALKGLSLADRREWRTALFRTQEAWQACYERRPEMKVEEQLSFMRDGREEAA